MRGRFVALMLLASLGAQATPYKKPTPAQAARIPLASGLNGADLERLKIGNQAGVLKVLGSDGQTRFLKGAETWNGGGIDGRQWAPLSAKDRDAILTSLNVKEPNGLALALLRNYGRLSRQHAVALLGVLAVPGEETAALSEANLKKVNTFLRARLQPEEDAFARRQAVLALAIQPKVDSATLESMLNYLKRDHNAWNTFGVVQFFELQKGRLPEQPDLEKRLKASGSPHTSQILGILSD